MLHTIYKCPCCPVARWAVIGAEWRCSQFVPCRLPYQSQSVVRANIQEHSHGKRLLESLTSKGPMRGLSQLCHHFSLGKHPSPTKWLPPYIAYIFLYIYIDGFSIFNRLFSSFHVFLSTEKVFKHDLATLWSISFFYFSILFLTEKSERTKSNKRLFFFFKKELNRQKVCFTINNYTFCTQDYIGSWTSRSNIDRKLISYNTRTIASITMETAT